MQRVARAAVSVAGETIGQVGKGLLIYLGVGREDTDKDLNYLAAKIAGLRIFPDDTGAMNRSIIDIGGGALVISQFTLFGDVRRGRLPSFIEAMAPERAEEIYEQFIARLEALGVPCAGGRFGAMMDVESINDGPVTILLDSEKLF